VEGVAGAGSGDEQQGAGALQFPPVPGRVGLLPSAQVGLRDEPVGHPGDDHVLVFQSLEAVHGADVDDVVEAGPVGADGGGGYAGAGEAGLQFGDHGAFGDADGDGRRRPVDQVADRGGDVVLLVLPGGGAVQDGLGAAQDGAVAA